MRSKHLALRVHEAAGLAVRAGQPLDRGGIVTVRHKADVLTVVLVRVAEAMRLGNGARLGLVQTAERKARVRELLLREPGKHIALILRRVHGLFERVAPVRQLLDAGIVPGRQHVAPERAGACLQQAELQIPVAVQAGVRRRPVLIGRGKARHDLLTKRILIIKDIVRHAQRIGHAAGILHIVERAAGVAARHAGVLIFIQLHGHAHAVVTRLLHQVCRHARIHAAAHGDHRLRAAALFRLHLCTSFSSGFSLDYTAQPRLVNARHPACARQEGGRRDKAVRTADRSGCR